ncbi:hypothetical protein PG994_012154 [Apiospora phragmitis]|uniref:Uncharacterized protein n=1 Tax=Apiospora phragmitis TaxID=2905665 RepID=A0ABR1TUU7_9PEZI
MGFPQQTIRPCRREQVYYYEEDSSSDESSRVESPLPLGTEPRFTMLLRSPASTRNFKGKAVANYEPKRPRTNDYNRNNAKPQGKRKAMAYYMPAVPARVHTCDDCDTIAGPAPPPRSPPPSVRSGPGRGRRRRPIGRHRYPEHSAAAGARHRPGHLQAQVREAAAADTEVVRILGHDTQAHREAPVQPIEEQARGPAPARGSGVCGEGQGEVCRQAAL